MNHTNYLFPFEKLEIWKLSIEISETLYKVTNDFPTEEKYGITSQLRRAGNSIGANIAEGSARFSEKDKARFIEISFGSLMEVAHFLYLSNRLGYLSNENLSNLKPRILEMSNKINAYHKKLNK
jgi:four helix bundle protein